MFIIQSGKWLILSEKSVFFCKDSFPDKHRDGKNQFFRKHMCYICVTVQVAIYCHSLSKEIWI